jgi:RES domain-containing protein
MFVYRISQTKYANSFKSPGIDARWNSYGKEVIYTAGSVALACLENLAHKSGAALSAGNFSIAIIDIDPGVSIKETTIEQLKNLNTEWYKVENYAITQSIGDEWLASMETAVMKVPSAIIELEFNYLLNPSHPEFFNIKIASVSKFAFDPRLKSNP